MSQRRSMTMRQESGTHGEGNAPSCELRQAAVNRIDVERRVPRARRHHRHVRLACRELRVELRLEAVEHGIHVAHRAVAQKRHGAVCDASMGLDLRPPHAAMTDAHAIHVQGLGDDDVVDARRRKEAALGQIMHAAVAAGFLVHGARDLERAGELRARIDEGLHGDDGGREIRPSCRTRRGRRACPRARVPAKGSTVQPAPVCTTSIWPLKCTHGPGKPLSRRAITLRRGHRSLSPAVPSARTYSIAKPRRASRRPMNSAHGR